MFLRSVARSRWSTRRRPPRRTSAGRRKTKSGELLVLEKKTARPASNNWARWSKFPTRRQSSPANPSADIGWHRIGLRLQTTYPFLSLRTMSELTVRHVALPRSRQLRQEIASLTARARSIEAELEGPVPPIQNPHQSDTPGIDPKNLWMSRMQAKRAPRFRHTSGRKPTPPRNNAALGAAHRRRNRDRAGWPDSRTNVCRIV